MYTNDKHPALAEGLVNMNVDTIRRIMSENKTTLPSFRNQDWRTVKFKTEKVNDLLTNIPTNVITELDDLIYANLLVSEKIGVPLKTTDRKSKPKWELRREPQIKRLRQQARILKRNIKKFSDETEKAPQLELKKKKKKLEETNQKY